MLPKRERLSRAEFNRFFSVGTRRHSPALQMVYAPHHTFHASVVVSKKVESKAVRRNKIRRRIYDILRRHQRLEQTTGVYIILVKPTARALTYEALQSETVQLITTYSK